MKTLKMIRFRAYHHQPIFRRLSTHPKQKNPEAVESLVEWLTSTKSSCPPPPPVTSPFTLQWRKNELVVSTHSAAMSVDRSHLHAVTKRMLSHLQERSVTLHRSPPALPPLHIEYSSPNIAKPLHMGHLRSTITGNFIRNVAESAGHRTTSVCLLGDWGRQFGVLHAGVVKQFGHEFKQIHTLELDQLLQLYVQSCRDCEENKAHNAEALRYSALLETGDADCKALWTHTRNVTLAHLQSCYSKLGVRFDRFEGESEFHRESKHTVEALELLESLNLTTRRPDGSLTIQIGDSTQVLLKQDNSSLYLLRDIACALRRKAEHGPQSRFVYVVDLAQTDHFKNLFHTLSNLGVSEQDQHESRLPFSSTHTHVTFGKVKGMSTRSGSFVLMSDVIDKGTALMHESRRRSRNARNIDDVTVSETLAVSGLVINALRVRRNKEYKFDWDEALRTKGDSGVALQYGLARLRSLLDKCDLNASNPDESLDVLLSLDHGQEQELVTQLIVCLMNFEDAFWRSYLDLEPCVLVAYAFNLNDKISKCLAGVNVLKNRDRTVGAASAWLFAVAQHVLNHCSRVIGVPVLDRGF